MSRRESGLRADLRDHLARSGRCAARRARARSATGSRRPGPARRCASAHSSQIVTPLRAQVLDVGAALQEPEQLVDHALGVDLLRGEQREALAPGRSASGSRRPRACRCRCGRLCGRRARGRGAGGRGRSSCSLQPEDQEVALDAVQLGTRAAAGPSAAKPWRLNRVTLGSLWAKTKARRLAMPSRGAALQRVGQQPARDSLRAGARGRRRPPPRRCGGRRAARRRSEAKPARATSPSASKTHRGREAGSKAWNHSSRSLDGHGLGVGGREAPRDRGVVDRDDRGEVCGPARGGWCWWASPDFIGRSG